VGHIITKKFLISVYLKKGLSTWAIEKKFDLSRSRVYNALKKHDIVPRSIANSHIRYKRLNFSGDLHEKAYLLGFAIGDLRVRKLNGKRGETISIGCGSTKSAQIELISRLFSRYGRVWKGKPNKRGATNIEVFVNITFAFLLPDNRDYTWCLKYKKHFFAFLAGFTDAEGSFYISNGQAFVSWGNYNVAVLSFIKEGLEKFGIVTPKIYQDNLKGFVGKHGYARNQNYSHLSCSRKEQVRRLLQGLEPFVLHQDKRSDMANLRRNLIIRGVKI